MVLYLLWAIATVIQNYGDRPYFSTLASAIALTLPTHRAIAMLKQNLGQGDRTETTPQNAIAPTLTTLTSTTVGLFNVEFGDDSIVLDVKGAECCVTSNGTGCN
jgi:hypothetical protein